MSETTIVAVTQFEYDKAPNIFDAAVKDGYTCIPTPADESELSQMIRETGARHVILGVEQYHNTLYDALPKGGVIARYGVGYDAIDLARATEKGILCVNTPGVLEGSVAEYTVTLILAAARHLPELHHDVRTGSWGPQLGRELKGKKLAIIGCGHIGCSVARIASAGFGMEVTGCEVRYVDSNVLKREYGFSEIVKDFSQAVAQADYVSLHIPSTPATKRFINARRLGLMPSQSWLVNTSRGAVVDEIALYDALSEKKIGGAALDVFDSEPYSPASPDKDLRTIDNVIMTPHIASSTVEACERVAERALRNIQLADQGEYENMDLLNPDVLLNLQ